MLGCDSVFNIFNANSSKNIFKFLILCVPIKAFAKLTDNAISPAISSHLPPLHQIFHFHPFSQFPCLLIHPDPPSSLHIIQHPLEPALPQCVTLSKLLGSSWSSSPIGRNQKRAQGEKFALYIEKCGNHREQPMRFRSERWISGVKRV